MITALTAVEITVARATPTTLSLHTITKNRFKITFTAPEKIKAVSGVLLSPFALKAAEMLNYSQSGISRMISDIEEDWKVTLLERGKSGVRLTSDGTRILPYVRNICEGYEKLQMQIDDINGLQSGFIRIGTFSSVATHWLPEIIKKFQINYPDIEYELLLGDYFEIEMWIAEGSVDCGFLRLPVKSDFETMSLKRDALLAVIPEDHPLADGEKFSLEAFEGQPFMMLEKGGNYEITELFENTA